MSLYDVLEEITEKKATKNPLGDNIIQGVTVGIVTENKDDENKGKISVQIPTRDDKSNILKVVKTAMPMCGKDWGFYFLPEVGDQVLLAFENGNIENPYIIGAIPKNATNFINQAYDSNNVIKKIKTKSGNQLEFYDKDKEEHIEMVTPKSQSFTIDDKEEKITAKDKDGKNKIVLETKDGNAVIEVEKKVTIKAGKTSIEINGESDSITITCGKLTIDASTSINEDTNTYSVKASSYTAKASGMASIKSDSMITIKGQTVSLG